MGQMIQRVALEPTRELFKATPLRAACTNSAVDTSAEMRRLRQELARTKRELKELRETAAHIVRALI